jgi:16S rRNA processing protein RimM
MNWGVNMEKVYVGKIVSTHGIKGEIKILSDFPFKDKVFKVGSELIIDNSNYIIKSYRVHKNFDMVTLDDYKDINEVLFLMKKGVYFSKDKLNLGNNEVLDEDLIKYEVLTKDGKRGIIKEIFLASKSNKILRIMFDKEVLIPLNSPMIVEINKDKRQVVVDLIEGM